MAKRARVETMTRCRTWTGDKPAWLDNNLAAQNVAFKALIAGCKNRQRQTAEEVWRAYGEAGVAVPDIVSDRKWNEFDMTGVFSEFAPLLSGGRSAVQTGLPGIVAEAGGCRLSIHHAWTDCDTQAMRAWMEDRYPCRTESWAAFRQRVLRARGIVGVYRPGDAVAIVTSAAPIAIWVAASLGVSDGQIMRITGVMYNSAVTTVSLARRRFDAVQLQWCGASERAAASNIQVKWRKLRLAAVGFSRQLRRTEVRRCTLKRAPQGEPHYPYAGFVQMPVQP